MVTVLIGMNFRNIITNISLIGKQGYILMKKVPGEIATRYT